MSGNEGAGEVIAVGPDVTDLKVGDRVAYVVALGAYAEERLMPADRAVKIPDNITYEQAAAMMLKGMTAEYLLRRTYKVQKGDNILVHAAAGGVGLILCQWGKALGANVIGTVGTEDKGKLAQANGCDHIIYYRKEDFAARVKEITKGELCAVVYDGIGKTTFPASLDCLRPLGMFASFGSASGQVEAFNINILQTKGSLFATRPTLNTYAAKRGGPARHRQKPVRGGRQRQGQDPDQPEVQAQGRREGAPGPGRPQHHGIDHPGSVALSTVIPGRPEGREPGIQSHNTNHRLSPDSGFARHSASKTRCERAMRAPRNDRGWGMCPGP